MSWTPSPRKEKCRARSDQHLIAAVVEERAEIVGRDECTGVVLRQEDAEEAGALRAELKRAGTPIGPFDLLIAAQARWRGAVLVTANATEFSRVPRLKVENWAAG